jgi:hypothetical protein
MIKLSNLIKEMYPRTVPDRETQKHGSGPADDAELDGTPALKNFAEIHNSYPGHSHHLKLVCKKCNNTETCRCSAPKTEIIGLCYECAGVDYNGNPK